MYTWYKDYFVQGIFLFKPQVQVKRLMLDVPIHNTVFQYYSFLFRLKKSTHFPQRITVYFLPKTARRKPPPIMQVNAWIYIQTH